MLSIQVFEYLLQRRDGLSGLVDRTYFQQDRVRKTKWHMEVGCSRIP